VIGSFSTKFTMLDVWDLCSSNNQLLIHTTTASIKCMTFSLTFKVCDKFVFEFGNGFFLYHFFLCIFKALMFAIGLST